MNIVLYIEDKKVDLNDQVQFAITRTFEELSNPTVIVNEWSKTLKIPFTINNNEIFGNFFNVDRRFLEPMPKNNMGVYFNPSRKANFSLYYNNELITTGYIKMSKVDNVNMVYECNLFGEAGNTFIELLKCSFNFDNINKVPKGEEGYDDSKLDTKYLLREPFNENTLFNAETVAANIALDKQQETKYSDIQHYYEVMNFALVEQGLPKDFEADTILEEKNGAATFTKLGDKLNEAKGIDFGDTIIGDGLTNRQMGQYRVQDLKPYYYVKRLWEMMEEKSKEICRYPIVLDPIWFNEKNPYYNDLVYLCCDIDTEKFKTTKTPIEYIPIDATDNKINYPYYFNVTAQNNYVEYLGFTLDSGINVEDMPKTVYKNKRNYTTYEFGINPHYYLSLIVKNEDDEVLSKYALVSNFVTEFIEDGYEPSPDEGYTIIKPTADGIGNFMFHFEIPIYNSVADTNYRIECQWHYYHSKDMSMIGPFCYQKKHRKRNDLFNYVIPLMGKPILIPSEGADTWNEDKIITMYTFWSPDVEPFKVLLNYSKMFGLIYVKDNINKCINVTCRNVYFENYKILDWTNKVNTNSTFEIKQPTFENKYVVFNYDSVEGDRYSDYEDKFRFPYGSKRLITEYEFNDNEENLFEGIQPTNIVQKKLVTYKQLFDEWNITSMPIPKATMVNEFYFDNENDNESTNIYSAFAFRLDSLPFDERLQPVCIRDITLPEINNDTQCYLGDGFDESKYPITKYPPLSFAYNEIDGYNYSCLFNIPNTLYVNIENKDKHNIHRKNLCIYDAFWRHYINERYTSKNKVVTLQVNITPKEYSEFEFRNLVKIGNTLYIVNTINDYDITDGENTKVELITIKDINAYYDGLKFAYSYFSDPDTNKNVTFPNIKSLRDKSTTITLKYNSTKGAGNITADSYVNSEGHTVNYANVYPPNPNNGDTVTLVVYPYTGTYKRAIFNVYDGNNVIMKVSLQPYYEQTNDPFIIA